MSFAHENELIHQDSPERLRVLQWRRRYSRPHRPHLHSCLLGRPIGRRSSPGGGWRGGRCSSSADPRDRFPVASPEQHAGTISDRTLRARPRYCRYRLAEHVGDTTWSRHCAIRSRRIQAQAASRVRHPCPRLEAHFEPYQSLDQRFLRPREFERRRQRLEQQAVLFPVNSSALRPEQSMRLDPYEDHCSISCSRRLREPGPQSPRHHSMAGPTTPVPKPRTLTLSRERAEHVYAGSCASAACPPMITRGRLGRQRAHPSRLTCVPAWK